MAGEKETTVLKDRISSDDGWKSFFLSALPWAECPFKMHCVVVTQNGKDDAARVFKELFNNDALEITECFEITVVRSDMWDKEKEKIRNTAN